MTKLDNMDSNLGPSDYRAETSTNVLTNLFYIFKTGIHIDTTGNFDFYMKQNMYFSKLAIVNI